MSSADDHIQRDEPSAVPERWSAVCTIAAATLLLVATEFAPIGVLSRIATDFRVSTGTAGLAITAPGFIAALVAPLCTIVIRSVNRRTVVVSFTAAIVVSNVLQAVATDFAVFLCGRIILGVAVGGLWTYAVAVGRQLVHLRSGARATMVISAGISAGTVFGMPVGAILGDTLGWRSFFAATAAVGLVLVLGQWRLLPSITAPTVAGLRSLAAFAKVSMARVGLCASAFVAAGHFVGYTFLEPFLGTQVGLSHTMVAFTLGGYAATGIIGSFLGEYMAKRNVCVALAIAATLLAASILGALILDATSVAALAAVLTWGAAFGAVPVCVQIWMFESSPALYEAGSALMVSAFQVSVALGAAAGGITINNWGISVTLVVASVLTLAGAFTAAMGVRARSDQIAQQPLPVEAS